MPHPSIQRPWRVPRQEALWGDTLAVSRYRAGRHINCNATAGCRTCLVSIQCARRRSLHTALKTRGPGPEESTSPRWAYVHNWAPASRPGAPPPSVAPFLGKRKVSTPPVWDPEDVLIAAHRTCTRTMLCGPTGFWLLDSTAQASGRKPTHRQELATKYTTQSPFATHTVLGAAQGAVGT
jgi:hypothetical protein